MSELQRLYKYKGLLNGRRVLSAQELMAHQEVSRATLKRDLAELRDHFHLPVRYDRDRGGYYIEQGARSHELPGLWLTEDEISVLGLLQQLVTQLQPGLISGKLDGLTSTAASHPQDPSTGLPQPSQWVSVLHARKRKVSSDCMDYLLQAILRRKRVHIVHFNRSTRVRTERDVSPQKIVLYRDNWYLAAWCHLREDFRSFAIDAIEQARPDACEAKAMDPAEVDDQLMSSYGIFAGRPRGWATLRFSAETAQWVASEDWHARQSQRVLPDGSLELRVPYSDDREIIADILRFGPEVQVVAPTSLRTKVQRLLLAAAARYAEPVL